MDVGSTVSSHCAAFIIHKTEVHITQCVIENIGRTLKEGRGNEDPWL